MPSKRDRFFQMEENLVRLATPSSAIGQCALVCRDIDEAIEELETDNLNQAPLDWETIEDYAQCLLVHIRVGRRVTPAARRFTARRK